MPSHAAAGGEALLGCQFDLQGDLLYSVSWYKDDKMFYRYKPGNRNAMDFPGKGISVDVSNNNCINMKNKLKRHCEADGDL